LQYHAPSPSSPGQGEGALTVLSQQSASASGPATITTTTTVNNTQQQQQQQLVSTTLKVHPHHNMMISNPRLPPSPPHEANPIRRQSSISKLSESTVNAAGNVMAGNNTSAPGPSLMVVGGVGLSDGTSSMLNRGSMISVASTVVSTTDGDLGGAAATQLAQQSQMLMAAQQQQQQQQYSGNTTRPLHSGQQKQQLNPRTSSLEAAMTSGRITPTMGTVGFGNNGASPQQQQQQQQSQQQDAKPFPLDSSRSASLHRELRRLSAEIEDWKRLLEAGKESAGGSGSDGKQQRQDDGEQQHHHHQQVSGGSGGGGGGGGGSSSDAWRSSTHSETSSIINMVSTVLFVCLLPVSTGTHAFFHCYLFFYFFYFFLFFFNFKFVITVINPG
jgi:hypothetical protein